MAREDMIRQDMQLVGTYNAIFEPTIKQLAKTERELSRAEKEWKKQGGQRICTMVNKTGAEYTAKSPYWTAVEDLRATVQGLRNQLGLTPTGLNKARAKSVPMGGTSKLEQLLSEAKSHAEQHGAQYAREVDRFVESVLSGEAGLCEDAVLACRRYVSDLDTGKWEFRAEPANEIIAIIETLICHQQGEFLDATPLRGTPFLLLPYHKFIVYNIMGFYLPGTKIRRFKEAVDFIPRKNVKTTFAAALAFALALYERASGSKVYEVGGALKQALEGFDFLKYNCARLGVTVKDEPETGLRIIDNNMERSISGDVGDGNVMHAFRPTNELARTDFSISPEGDVSWYTGTFSTDEKIAGREDLCGEHYAVPAVHACHLENNTCFAYMDGRRMVVYSCNQVPHTLRRNIAEAIGMPLGDVRVVKPFLGGGFGNKQDTMYEPLVALASQRLGGRCVAITLSREETFVNTRTRHGFDMTIAAAADEAGDLTHRGIRINSNGGSYAAHTHAVAAYAVTSNFQTYKASAVQIGESSTVYTNLPSAAAMRGYGIPQLNFAMESQMEDIARRNGWDPIDFRLQNINEAGFVDPFDKFTVRTCGLRECVEQGRRLCDWDRKRKEYDAFNKTSPNLKKGLGMALFSYKIGVYPLQLESGSCRIVMNEDGSAQIMVGCAELGQGSDTAMCQIVSQITTIPEQKLSVRSAQDTDITPYDNGAYASRQTYISGSGAKLAAEKLVDTILAHAARTYKLPKGELRLASEQIWHRDSAVCTLAQLCTYINFVNDQKTDTDHITAEATFTMKNICLAYGVSFMDLEVDVPMGKVKIRKVYCLQDSGKIINPQLAEGQMHGGVAMGIGYALGEQMLFDAATGRPLNNNLLDYKIPTCMDIPDMEIRFVETHEDSAPFGAKGLAEPPLIPQAAAVRNAILHATGVGMHKLPMNPQNLVHAFGEAGLIAQ